MDSWDFRGTEKNEKSINGWTVMVDSSIWNYWKFISEKKIIGYNPHVCRDLIKTLYFLEINFKKMWTVTYNWFKKRNLFQYTSNIWMQNHSSISEDIKL